MNNSNKARRHFPLGLSQCVATYCRKASFEQQLHQVDSYPVITVTIQITRNQGFDIFVKSPLSLLIYTTLTNNPLKLLF